MIQVDLGEHLADSPEWVRELFVEKERQAVLEHAEMMERFGLGMSFDGLIRKTCLEAARRMEREGFLTIDRERLGWPQARITDEGRAALRVMREAENGPQKP